MLCHSGFHLEYFGEVGDAPGNDLLEGYFQGSRTLNIIHMVDKDKSKLTIFVSAEACSAENLDPSFSSFCMISSTDFPSKVLLIVSRWPLRENSGILLGWKLVIVLLTVSLSHFSFGRFLRAFSSSATELEST